MVFLNPLFKRFQEPFNFSPNIGCFRLYVTNVMVTYVMLFFERFNWNFFFECSDDFRVWYQIKVYIFANMEAKHAWKQTMQVYKNHMFLQNRCFQWERLLNHTSDNKYIIKCPVKMMSGFYPWLLNRYHMWFGRCKDLAN